ncbi:muconolactone delta-isomerase [Nakamurella sp. YIM 132087]|uniref:Muconolactone delta-isomerase n=1 Tax=Nakamurella alba TaxID=2665158 RepID=A0A7K1FQ34_9ACTN|nr:muconolactone Delta-isomerase family protein [Nakamurella alba]MTD16180.1 muconolactone delta-isomerase [Nakamurella alba]
MAEFLVFIDNTDLWALPRDEFVAVVEREQAAGLALLEKGTLQKLWRLPGEKGNVGIWSATDADELHEALQSLPIFPYARIQVRALATHPLHTGDYTFAR